MDIQPKSLIRNIIVAFLMAFFLSACYRSTTVNDETPTTKEMALQKIMAYAENGTNSRPTLQDYIDAGVSGVSSDNLAELNTIIDGLELTDVDTIAELEVLTATLKINIAPIANAGTDTTVEVNKTIQITGSGSDSDGTIASYQWTKGSTVLATTAVLSYTPTMVGLDTLTLTVTDNGGATASASVNIEVRYNVNFVVIAVGGSPVGTYWYLGDKQWERDTWYDCQGFTETGRDESSIFLTNFTGTEDIQINLKDMIITSSNPNDGTSEVLDSGSTELPRQSSVRCPSHINQAPKITSSQSVEVNSGRTMILTLAASDLETPTQNLSFSLTDNPTSDNNFFKISNFNEKAHTVCRGNPLDPNNPNDYIVHDGVNSIGECQDACNEYPLDGGSNTSCKGVEFRAEGADSMYPEARCELWKSTIVTTAPHPSYSCFQRESDKPQVLSFIDAPDFKVPLDADVNNIYELEAQVSDGVDGKTSTQDILVKVIPNGNYLGKSGTACRAGTEDEGNPKDLNNADYFTITNDVGSVEACQALCDAYPLSGDPATNCMGVEYRSEGADYADTTSRCELWKAPIVATTPQKEYGCFVRDLTRDSYGPAIDAYVGEYKASYIQNGVYITEAMSLTTLAQNELLWTDKTGQTMTVTRTADRNTLNIAGVTASVIWDADEIAGIDMGNGRIYRTEWAHAKMSHSQAVYRDYINNHPSELIRVEEAERQIRELKWAIAEQINTAQAYRDYKNDIGTYYGRTQEADRRIGSFKAFVTAEVLSIEVDDSVPANPFGENNDLELFYNLEFSNDWNPRADEAGWSAGDVMLTSVSQSDGSKITNINDGADRAFTPAGAAEKAVAATENLTLRYGGLIFEMDSMPEGFSSSDEIQKKIDDCNWYGPGDFETRTCEEIFKDLWNRQVEYLFSDTSVNTANGAINGIFSNHWDGHRTLAGNVSTASESLDQTYFTIALEDLEYGVPKKEIKSTKFESDEEVRITYEFTKRTEEQHVEHITANTLYCDDPVLKPGKLMGRSSVTIAPPGFLIRNETDHTYSVSLSQVGPLYYGEVTPGKIFVRDTAWGHFTIDAKLNLTGEQRYSDWDVAGPIVIFTAQVLHTAFTAGAPISSIKLAIDAAGKKLIVSAAAKAAASGLASRAFGRALLRAGVKAIQLATGAGSSNAKIRIATALAKQAGKTIVTESIDYDTNNAFDGVFAQDLAEHVYSEDNTEEYRSWRYSSAWPYNVGMYHIVGGPRLPCLAADGQIEIRSSKLEILNDEECAARPDICTLH